MQMPEFIFDLLVARGWSIRHLSELTGLSYSGVRDFLKGLPNRLSMERIQRVYDILNLDDNGMLKPSSLYAWRIECRRDSLAALNRILRVTLELESMSVAPVGATTHLSKFVFITLLGGGTEQLPAPYAVLTWQDIYVLVRWSLPVRQVKKISHFHAENKTVEFERDVNPGISFLSSVVWASQMEISATKLCGIQLSPAQINLLEQMDASGEPDLLTLDTLKQWLLTVPVEDAYWTSINNKIDWTWDRVLQALQHRYVHPAQAAKSLRLM